MPSDGLPKDLEPLNAGDPASIGPYVLSGRLGSGGMGTVYLGRSPEKNAQVAIKVIRPELAFDEATRARFHDEMENARRVASFCTAKVLDHGTFENRPYMVTEYIAGTGLAEHIAKNGPLDSSTLHGFALGVAAALAAIHKAGLVHRDLKPANVILSISGPRVIDFGIARAMNTATNHTQTGIVMGSPGWMAPEQLLEEKVTPAADIFAWGCLVAFAGTGAHPFGNGDAMTLGKRVLFAEPQISGLDSPLDRLVPKALTKERERRPNAQDLLLELAGGGPEASDAHDMVSSALYRSWRPNLPPMPPMPPQGHPQGPPQGPHPQGPPPNQPNPNQPNPNQTGSGLHRPGPQPVPPVGPPHPPPNQQHYPGQPHQQAAPPPPGPPMPNPALQSQPMQRPVHQTGQFAAVPPNPAHTGPIPRVPGPNAPPVQAPTGARPQAQPYVPPVPPPPHAPVQPTAKRRLKWLAAAVVAAIVLLLVLYGVLNYMGPGGVAGITSGSSEADTGEKGGEAPKAGPEVPADAVGGGKDGPIFFVVHGYDCRGTDEDRVAQPENGRFCTFRVEARNTSDDTTRIDPQWQALRDSSGGSPNMPLEPVSGRPERLFETIEAGRSVEGELVFMVLDGLDPATLILRGTDSSEGLEVPLRGNGTRSQGGRPA
ncbi:serine/threonine protein kinase [Murinocardiopsis flavida]|uniref:Serine/threonine protein kinase n=1 Tax=Murinocardiopsis flavida TaxID=645275 RepID=A0A2P8DMD9_9ACTN|nr:serine/threonine-protein kinase [Murinocardiopsis flavida]PSK98375.1 serine/threonine protein kinase [Murinocardiopsis flavida]